MFKKIVRMSCAALSSVMLTAAAAMPAAASEPHTEDSASDWASPRSIVEALHETVSADPGKERAWDRYRDLFVDGAKLSMAARSPRMPGIMAATPEEMIERTEASYASTGFHEIPLVIEAARFGAMAVVTSSFEVRLRRDDTEPLMRGLNHFQLLHDGERWWIVSNVSTLETADWKLPAAFDPGPTAESRP